MSSPQAVPCANSDREASMTCSSRRMCSIIHLPPLSCRHILWSAAMPDEKGWNGLSDTVAASDAGDGRWADESCVDPAGDAPVPGAAAFQATFFERGWPATMRRRAEQLRRQVERELRAFSRRLCGRQDGRTVRIVAYAVVDAPFAAVRRHVAAHKSPPPD